MAVTPFSNTILFWSVRWGGEVGDTIFLEISDESNVLSTIIGKDGDNWGRIVFFD